MPESGVFKPQPETANVLNFVANHDAKAATYTALSQEGDITAYQLGSSMAAHTGKLACKTLVRGYLPTFVGYDFADLDYDFGGGSGKQMVRYYRANNEEMALPVLGTLLEWSEEHNESLL